MLQTIRVFFSVVWFVASGAAVASGLGFIVTWGGYADILIWSVLTWLVSTGLIVGISAIE